MISQEFWTFIGFGLSIWAVIGVASLAIWFVLSHFAKKTKEDQHVESEQTLA